MINTLLPQSQLTDPYSLYEECVLRHPIYWDDTNKIWALYSYEYCLKILNDENAQVPAVRHFSVDVALDTVSANLVRLSNPPKHNALKTVAFYLFDKLKKVSISEILFSEIEKARDENLIDWAAACRKLFPTLIIKGFDFQKEEEAFLMENVPLFVKLMGALNDEKSFGSASKIINKAYEIVNRHFAGSLFAKQEIERLASAGHVDETDILEVLVSNFIGLLIQSYDAGRGLLVNGLVQLLQYREDGNEIIVEESIFRKIVIETLRFDPPVHNTRRIATADILIEETMIKKSQTMLLVLAAANRDATKFPHPNVFNINRPDDENLSFGAGGHACLAKHFCIDVATKIFLLLFAKFPSLKLLPANIQYEPLVNVRIPKNLLIKLQ